MGVPRPHMNDGLRERIIVLNLADGVGCRCCVGETLTLENLIFFYMGTVKNRLCGRKNGFF